jgi:2-methylisocitrate lyase-like PEP mutase family enzyme
MSTETVPTPDPPAVDPVERAERFLALHQGPGALLMPNAWDAGSARLLVSLGFKAVASTSSGFAATMGKLDGAVCLNEAMAHSRVLVNAAGTVPVSADLENGFGPDPADVRLTVLEAVSTGLAGCSIEDYSGDPADPIYDRKLAVERVETAVSVAHRGPVRLVLTARAENLIRGRTDLADTIARLQAYQEAGADVLFAPGLRALPDIRSVVTSVDRPVNVLALPGGPTVAELAEAGVARISVGGAFAYAAYGALLEAATELRDEGTYGYWDRAAVARSAVGEVFPAG